MANEIKKINVGGVDYTIVDEAAARDADLAAVAKSGSYKDLKDTPSIPGVSDATITIKQTGKSDQTFTLNGSATTITLNDANTTYSAGTGLSLSGTKFSVNYGKTSSTACVGNDSRLSDARTPTSHSHGNITNAGLLGTANRVVITDKDKKITTSSITTTELEYLDNVSSNIQTQLNGKAPTSHGTHVTAATVKSALGVSADGTKYLKQDGTWATPSNNKVKQNAVVTTDANYPVFFATDTTSAEVTGYVNKAEHFLFNPSTDTLKTQSIELSNQLTVSKAESGQDSLIRSVSTQASTDEDVVWRGRIIAGAKNKTFLLGVYKNMCGIGAHYWTDALAASGAGWEDIYFNPDGGAKIYLGGYGWTKDSGVMKIENAVKGAYINVSSLTAPIWRKISYHINHEGDNNSNESTAGAYSYVIGCGTAGDESMVWTDSPDASAGENSVLIGGYSDLDPYAGNDSVGIGNSVGAGASAIAIGSFASAGSGCVSVGAGAQTTGLYSVAIGESAASREGQIAIGASANVTAGACGSIVIGESAYVATNSNTYCQQLVIGKKSYAHSGDTGDTSWNYITGQIVIGHCAKATDGDGCIVIGNSTHNNTPARYPYASGLNCIVIGSADVWSNNNGARAYGLNCIAVGMGSVATGSGNIAIGRQATARSTSSISIGPSSTASGPYAIAIGTNSTASGAYAIAIGTSVTAKVSGSKGLVCIGNSSSNYRYYGGTATTWSSGSDIRDKTDIEPLTGGVDLIKAIQPIIYRENPRDAYSETGSLLDYDKDEHAKATKAGFKYLASFKAQEVAKYMEDNYGDESFNNIIDHERWYDDVNDENIDRYFMAYGDLVPFMFQAIKEQQEVIEEQEERINSLENKLNELLKRVG